jgi:DNA-binding LacI/PurR family transcriptional regulator
MQYVMVIAETARKLDYDVLIVTEDEGASGISRVTDSNTVDGVIVLDVQRHDARVAALQKSRHPGVLVGVCDPENSVMDAVDLDFASAGSDLMRHLYEQGHRDVSFITLPDVIFDKGLTYAWLFRESALRTANELSMQVKVVAADADPVKRSDLVASILDERHQHTALLVHNDGAMVDLQRILHERGLRVPEDVAVASLFSAEFGQMFSLPFTAIETSAEQVASQAVELLAHRIEDPDTPTVQLLLTPKIIERGTSRRV